MIVSSGPETRWLARSPWLPCQCHGDWKAKDQQQHGDTCHDIRPLKGHAGQNDDVLDAVS
jgi:hypothetical protein